MVSLPVLLFWKRGRKIKENDLVQISHGLYRNIRICVGETTESLEMLPYSLRTSYTAYNLSFLNDGRGIIRYAEAEKQKAGQICQEQYMEYSLLKKMIFKEQSGYKEYVDQVFETYRTVRSERKYIVNQCTEALKYLCSSVNEYLMYKTMVTVADAGIGQAEDLSEVKRLFIDQMELFMNRSEKRKMRRYVRLSGWHWTIPWHTLMMFL